MANKKEITKESIKRLVYETAVVNKKKEELWEKFVNIVNELEVLEETHKGMVGSYGFSTPSDNSNKTKTGFENDFYLGRISDLGAEIQAAREAADAEAAEESAAKDAVNEDLIDQISELKKQLEDMKKEQESLKEAVSKDKK